MNTDLQGFVAQSEDTSELIDSFLQKHLIFNFSNRDEQLVALAKAVAEIPWGMGRTVQEVLVSKGVGTCTGKHRVLQNCFEVLNIPYETVVCIFKWSDQGIEYPASLKKNLDEGEEWKHGHNFVRAQKLDGQWFDLDINWDFALGKAGFITAENWDGQSDLVAVKNSIDRWDGAKIGEMKIQLIEFLSDDQRRRREEFLDGLIEWTASLR